MLDLSLGQTLMKTSSLHCRPCPPEHRYVAVVKCGELTMIHFSPGKALPNCAKYYRNSLTKIFLLYFMALIACKVLLHRHRLRHAISPLSVCAPGRERTKYPRLLLCPPPEDFQKHNPDLLRKKLICEETPGGFLSRSLSDNWLKSIL